MTTFTTQDRQDAQRTPLTDEQVRLLINDVPDYDIDTYDLLNFARAIERAHGIGE